MSYALYRKGFTHRVDGVECEVARVELNQLDEYRANGWVDDIEDIDGAEPESDRVGKIVEALELLETDNPEHFTENGNPKLDAVRTLVGDDSIDKKDLNAAWKLFTTQE